MLKMSHGQLHDFASTKGLAEHTPVKFLKREGISLESEEAEMHAGKGKKFKKVDYISGIPNNPNSTPKDCEADWYDDHGAGE